MHYTVVFWARDEAPVKTHLIVPSFQVVCILIYVIGL